MRGYLSLPRVMMSAPPDTIDLMLRAAAAALSLFAGVQFARMRPVGFLTIAGATFGAAAAAYALVSGPLFSMLAEVWREALVVPAVLLPVFFWWFALALFRDRFAIRPVHTLPAVLLLAFYVLRREWGGGYEAAGTLLHQATVALLLAHVVSLAVRDFRNDLVDVRRRFRIAVALLIPLAGIVIVAAETWEVLSGPLPFWLSPLHALLLASLSFPFALWLTMPKPELFAPPAAAPLPRTDLLTPAELIELDRLRTAVSEGVCMEPELSLAALGARIAVPEHRLRRLIGKGLGYRNFATFLNEHRVEEAKRRLADPARAREQIATIAFDLGYASLAPFNRAFRQIAGTTPSEYRAKALFMLVDSAKV